MIIEKIKKYLKEDPDFLIQENIPEDASLVDAGILDSFSIVKLMMFVEKEFDIKIEVEDLTEDNISTLKNIEALILRKQNSN